MKLQGSTKALSHSFTLFIFVLAASPALAQITGQIPDDLVEPADNPSNPEKIELGRLLFWDPILSGNQDVACATCHHPDFGYSENLDISIGVNGVGLGNQRRFSVGNDVPFVMRNSPSVLNTAFNGMDEDGRYDPSTAPMFWDMRASSLEEQSLMPIVTYEEMRGPEYTEEEILDEIIGRLENNPEYSDRFTTAFSDQPSVSAENLAKALAAFERTLVAADSPYDRYLAGDESAMTRRQVEGMQAFEEVGCAECHSGPMFSDYQAHILAVPDNNKLTESDQGVNLSYAFRTPSLRNLRYTSPYMHSGVFDDLDDVLSFYDGGRRNRNRNVSRNERDILFRRLDDVDDHENEIIAFLEALNDDNFDRTIPERVPSGLAVGGLID